MKTENMKTVGAALLCTLAICTSPIGAIAQSVCRNGSATKDTYVFFKESERLEYKDAVAKARENDPRAYYWLAYYFGKGDGVAHDEDASWRCLSKSASLGYPEANYAKALLIVDRSIRIPESNGGLFKRRKLTRSGSLLGSRLYDANSDADVTTVEALFNCAITGGIVVATNDLARFQTDVRDRRSAIADAKAAAVSANALKAEADDILKALEQEEHAWEDAKSKADDEERKIVETEAAYWATWPGQTGFYLEEIRLACAEELGVVIQIGDTNIVWNAGCGKSLIVPSRPIGQNTQWMKFDDTGRLIKSGPPKDFFDEYTWLTNRAAQVRARRITDWATDHGMTYDEAVQKHNEFLSKDSKDTGTRGAPAVPRRGLLGSRTAKTNEPSSLRERRALREQARAEERSAAEEKARIAAKIEAQRYAEAAAEYEQREREREEQRAQLMQIQDELRKAREERAK